ncbi:MAG TPA: ECF-type sigma factor [Terriglobales bacterium]|nr:ECF-type sigma factor [Terriglobales bacterium]
MGEPLIHFALRRKAQKTVMGLQDTATGRAPGGAAGESPEERRELDLLFSVTYEELRRLASSVRRRDPGATLSPTTLVNEAWIKLAKSPRFAATSRLHFKRIAARAMRQVLIEAARRRHAGKRGGAELALVTFDESTDGSRSPAAVAAAAGQDLLALDAALDELAKLHPRQAMMVESRFFGGLDITETAQLLDVSEATIQRDWRAAKAWLAHELRGTR